MKIGFYDNRKLLMELIPFVIIIFTFAIAIYAYPILPQKIPTHWNAAGVVDNYSDKVTVFMIPIIFLVAMILLFVLPLIEVFRDNMIKIYKYYYWFKISFSIFFMVLFIATLLPNFGYNLNVAYVVIMMVGLLFIALGFTLPKLKRNYMFGIRTGWTLSNDKVWEKTHKIGGILFIAAGVLTLLLLILLPLEMLFFAFVGLILFISIFLVWYSYFEYKKLNIKKK